MKPIQTKDLFDYRFLSGLKAAPSAERLAFVVSACDRAQNGYSAHIWLWEKGKARALTGMGQERDFFWEDNEHILFPALRREEDKKRTQAGERFTCFYRLDIRGGEAQRAFEIPLSCGSMKPLGGDLWFFTASVDARCPDLYKAPKKERERFAAEQKKDEDYHVFTGNPWWLNGQGFLGEEHSALFVYNMRTGTLHRVSDTAYDVDTAAAIGGKLYFSGEHRDAKLPKNTPLFCYDPAGGESVCLNEGEMLRGIYEITPFRGKLLCLADEADAPHGMNSNCVLCLFDGTTGEYEKLCAPDLSFGSSVGSDLRYGGGSGFKVFGDALYAISTLRNSAILQRYTPETGFAPVCEKTGSLDCFEITAGGSIYGVALYDMLPQELYALSEGPRRLTHFNKKALAGKYLALPEKLTISSAGWDIDGWVLYPRDYDPAKRYPAVLDIHGGPKTVYGEVFSHEMQSWASKGWFVFFCNPMGSDGRGDAFMDIRGKYGTTDYQNIMDFTDAVLERFPQIDPQRVGVTGGSYGGFMTNWIIGHTDRFACAATQRSISNWISFYGVSDIGIHFTRNEQAAALFDAPEKLWEHSPLKYAGNVSTPTLFIHSDEDYRCPISEGLQLYTALVDRGVEARFVWFKGENHELSRSGKPLHRLRRLEEITDWMAAHIEK